MLRSVGVKFIDLQALSRIENSLRNCNENHRDRQVRVKLEAYTSINKDRKILDSDGACIKVESDSDSSVVADDSAVKQICMKDIDIAKKLEHPSKKRRTESEDTVSGVVIVPFSTRRWKSLNPKKNLFKNLVLALNQSFTNYEFGSATVQQFQRATLSQATSIVNRHFFELACGTHAMKVCETDLWVEIENIVGHPVIDPVTNEVVSRTMEGVQIYSYIPDNDVEIDADPLSSLGNLWSFNYFFCNPSVGKVVFLACSCRQRKFSQTSDTIPGLVSHNSFFEAWEEDVSSDDEIADEVDDSKVADKNVGNMAVAF